MEQREIAHLRLWRHHLAGPPLPSPAAVVRWLGAVQAQDYSGAKWAVAQRCADATDALLDQALAAGDLLRTHVLRPTWHFVAPEDIRWLLALTAPHVHQTNASYYRKYELDDATVRRCRAVIEGALQGGQQLTRPELAARLAAAGITPGDTVRQTFIFMRAELAGVICSGGLRGKQHTYALLAERVPPAPLLDRDAALAELARRYFTSRGPATLRDFQWWSGLPAADARRGLAAAQSDLRSVASASATYWFGESPAPAEPDTERAYVLPNYDEFSISYADRAAIVSPAVPPPATPRDNIVFANMIVVGAQIVGIWRRAIRHKTALLTATLYTPLSPSQERALSDAADRMGAFLGVPARLEVTMANHDTALAPAPHAARLAD